MTKKEVFINFNQLIGQYWENLTNTLRSFQASEDHEFLEMWVPNDDPILCLKDIIELASDNQIGKLNVYIKCDESLGIRSDDIEALAEEVVGEICCQSEDLLILTVSA